MTYIHYLAAQNHYCPTNAENHEFLPQNDLEIFLGKKGQH